MEDLLHNPAPAERAAQAAPSPDGANKAPTGAVASPNSGADSTPAGAVAPPANGTDNSPAGAVALPTSGANKAPTGAVALPTSGVGKAPTGAAPRFALGGPETLAQMPLLPPLPPFDEAVLALFDDVAHALRGERARPELAAFGFWCRRASLCERRDALGDLSGRLGRGVTLHIAPSNVPLNFAYSLAAGLLAGCACIVRLPSAAQEEVDALCGVLGRLLADRHRALAPYLCCLRYGHEQEITDYLSSLCDVRIIWGGDETIARIRRSPVGARAFDLCFADRWSVAVVDAGACLALDGQGRAALARAFYNDTYRTDQMACTAPHLVYWTGERVAEARAAFWQALAPLLEGYPVAGATAVAKRELALRLAAACPGARLEPDGGNALVRMWLPCLPDDLACWRTGGGFFLEAAGEAAALAPRLTARCQTLTYFGAAPGALRDALLASGCRGVDRVAPMGRSMEFSLIWDGHDLVRTLSRQVDVR